MPIESSMLPPDMVEYLNAQEAMKSQAAQDAQNAQHYDELLSWCNGFIEKAKAWRKQSFEFKWHLYRRNAESIYDQQVAKAKKDWQSKAFIPITASHKETIQAQLFKTMVGPRPLLEMKARGTFQFDQSENIRDMILREMERAKYEFYFNGGLDDALTYGSGFFRVRWEEKYEERMRRKPVLAPVDTTNPVEVQRSMMLGPQVIGYQDVMEPVLVYRGVRFDPISIWDVFADPQALEVQGNTVAIRYRMVYGDLVKGAQGGYYLPDAVFKLKDAKDPVAEEEDTHRIKADRLITDTETSKTDYQNSLTCYELYARVPKKWALAQLSEQDDPEALIPARIIFHRMALLAIEPSGEYDGEAPLYKMDYFPVQGQFYGRGVPEMLKDIQAVENEAVNQRLDAVNLALTKKYGVIERALVSSKDFNDELGGVIRFDLKQMQNGGLNDIRSAFMELNTGTVDRAAFIDPQEMERYAQERTSANRVTIGTAGQVRDQNDTLGGMELLRQSAGEKFAYIGMLMEFSAIKDIFRAFWKQIYTHVQPQDVIAALGPERAQTFQLLSPEEIEQDYAYVPQGVFTAENKSLTQARLQAMYTMFADQPWLDRMAFFDEIAQANNQDPQTLKLSPEEMQMMMMAQMDLQMANTPLPTRPPSDLSVKTEAGGVSKQVSQ